MQKRLGLVVFSAILVLLMAVAAGCGGGSGGDSNAGGEINEVTLKLAHNAQVNSPIDLGTHKFAELVEQKSSGKMTVEIYPANQLGGNREIIEQTTMGGIDIVVVGLGVFGYLDDRFMMMQVPFLFRSQEQIHEALDGELGNELKESMLENSIYMLDMNWDRLPRQITSNKPIKTIEDMKGQIIRAGATPPIEVFKRMGAEPTKVPLNEMYLAVQQGVVHGVELPTDYIYDYSIYEVNKYCNMLNHTYGTLGVGLSAVTKEKLSAKQLQILEEAAKEAGEYQNELTWNQQADYEEKLAAAGMILVKPDDITPFVEAVKDMIPELEQIWPNAKGMAEKIYAIEAE
ncbi:TRAP transporter substrate-binding protein [Desulfoscipio geothermicus]|uniref:Tripartite ATP-independent transporter solute receptor, DctP family n=1 Tax=Desulfoscipio geothermicus DSM 3669 TaxID=1121426 RepID=A0A1I6DEN1_9FIRM|nr:TRAP transporter substrate-binding protein [Desulfoscipio geothermicus]SFR03884.1 tripartite ATP-independent transporter solute receptor, DctP family [Desulfoscipio geothermicus DSM 3669]